MLALQQQQQQQPLPQLQQQQVKFVTGDAENIIVAAKSRYAASQDYLYALQVLNADHR
jgi:hypothetical protein